ncbi:MAG: hypothetical protein M1150_01635 [Patescibacteria group bacterium]|nr:hypothetical protein [Patescibacteria group bacterium]
METIKFKALPIIEEKLKGIDILLDEKDLKYQVLFRLTTYEAKEIFNQKFENYLVTNGIYNSWRNILTLNSSYLQQFQINEDLVVQIMKEQLRVIRLRIKNTSLPLNKILSPDHEIFDLGEWVIERSNGEIFTTNGQKKVKLLFAPVDKSYAIELHDKLHYIHCARLEEAYGLFVEGSKIPFSVLGVERIDRDYKKTAVLLKGYNHDKVIDFTRLYSFPNSPRNTSSVILSLTRDYLRRNTDTQAVLTAFMPSYANGMSMFAGGMDEVLIAKPLRHVFEEIPGSNLYQHVVKRSQTGQEDKIVSKILLLPTLELLSPVTQSPLKPRSELEGMMVDLT